MIDWNISKKDFTLIGLIADRVRREWPDYPDDRRSLIMDLNACHSNGCPLDLAGLLEANELDFSHDIGDIRKHINRSTGKIEGCFVPRYAQSNAVPSVTPPDSSKEIGERLLAMQAKLKGNREKFLECIGTLGLSESMAEYYMQKAKG